LRGGVSGRGAGGGGEVGGWGEFGGGHGVAVSGSGGFGGDEVRRRAVGRSGSRTVVPVVRRLAVGVFFLSVSPTVRPSGQTRPPPPTPLSPVRFPPFKEATLGNGLQLVLVERHEQPVVSVSLSLRAGGICDPPGKEGLAELVAELLTKGTANRSAEQIAATIEGVGGSLS